MVWLDQVYPMYAKVLLKPEALIGIAGSMELYQRPRVVIWNEVVQPAPVMSTSYANETSRRCWRQRTYRVPTSPPQPEHRMTVCRSDDRLAQV